MDNVKIVGSVNLTLHDENGNIKEIQNVPNMIVTVGRNEIAQLLGGHAGGAVMTHMGVGTNNTAPTAGNTALLAQLVRVVLTSTGVTNNVVSYTATFGAGVGTGAITEAGLFNHATAGDMLCRTTFLVINKGAADALTINWNVTIN